jgi:three-Cys-motif partner protein
MSSDFYADREQTEVKHQVLSRYLSAFVPIVGDWASDIAYVDCLAGPWNENDPDLTDTSFSRAIEVLRDTRRILQGRGKSPTMRCLLIEKKPESFKRLEKFCTSINDIELAPKNWDFTTRIDEIVRFIKSRTKSFPFVFIDPTGWEPLVDDLITPILKLQPCEVLINLVTSWITRFLSDETKHFERLLGPQLQRLRQLNGWEQEEELVRMYATKIAKAGNFKYTCTLPVMKPDQDAFHFYMVYATRHTRGVEVFKETEKHVIPFMHEKRAKAQERKRIAESGQYSLLSAEAHYKERRFTEFQLRNLAVAKNRLRTMIQTFGELLYDDAWFNTMQYSAVTDRDIKDWLLDWKTSGLIAFPNLHPGQSLPRKGENQVVKWRGGKS